MHQKEIAFTLERITPIEEEIMPVVPLEVFISYAHEDQALKDELCAHLSNLQRQGLIKTWHDGNILAGTEWEQQIIEHLTSAHLILLLISSDFMASDFCFSVEMQQAMARHQTNQARAIPILVRQTDWQHAPFSILQMVPTGAKPVANWSRRDDVFTDVVKGIRKAIEDVKENGATLSRAADTTSVESIPMPLWNVPSRRNSYYTGQEAILKYLHTTLKSDKAAALTQPQAISGLGGIGKTQIALEYAYRHRQTYRAILWMQADTREALILGFISLANLLQLPHKDAQDQNVIVEAVKDWLETNERWLLILDNADDLMLLDQLLPIRSGGHLLLNQRAHAYVRLRHAIEI